MTVLCLNCGDFFDFTAASYDELGWHTSCPCCKASFDVEPPNYSEELQDLFDYCRVSEIKKIDDYLNVIYNCDTSDENRRDSIDSCNDCPKAGCHIYTAAHDAELLLNGENELYQATK